MNRRRTNFTRNQRFRQMEKLERAFLEKGRAFLDKELMLSLTQGTSVKYAEEPTGSEDTAESEQK